LADADTSFYVFLRLRRPARSTPLELYSGPDLASAVEYAERYLARHDRLSVLPEELTIRLGQTLNSPVLTLAEAEAHLRHELDLAQSVIESVLSAKHRRYDT
jgi:hypothetical protein